MVGGNGGAGARLSGLLADQLDDEQAMELVDKVVEWFVKNNRKGRLGKFVNEMGFETFKQEIMGSK
jgi:NAD(P)H-nitrite reductase large subunit